MKNTISFFFTLILFTTNLQAQSKITVEDIWKDYIFYPSYVTGFNFMADGQHYTKISDGKLTKYDITDDQPKEVILDLEAISKTHKINQVADYKFSQDENQILLSIDAEQIYRHSSKASYYLYRKGILQSIHNNQKIMYPTFNPQGTKIAYVFENNIYIYNIDTQQSQAITKDGKINHIINGATDWVYEEEFSFHVGFQWSPSGSKIAYYKFDESEVPVFDLHYYEDGLYPDKYSYKYPKVGEKNAIVSIHFYDLKSRNTTKAKVNLDNKNEYYIPRIKWTNNDEYLCITELNRIQNNLFLYLSNPNTGASQVLIQETNPYYIDIHDNLTFIDNNKGFIWTSEMTGRNHAYVYDMSGKLLQQITKGPWSITEFYGYNPSEGNIYYQANKKSPLFREVYSTNIKSSKTNILESQKGWNSAQFSTSYKYYLHTYSTAETPPRFSIKQPNSEAERLLQDNKRITQLKDKFNAQPVSFMTIPSDDSISLNAYMIKPANFDDSTEYPVFMYLYGGPGSQSVKNAWGGQNYWWFQMLSQQGYIVVCVDNRGTGGRGQYFKKQTYLELGKLETVDQINAAKYLGQLKYTDPNRIGIFGWSYGGYMSSLCLLKGNETFKAAIAVAPVTNWKWYDSVYTERYMQTLATNPDGYKNNSPVYFADRLKGNYLLIHGMADDNVHFQHTAEMAKALIAANKQFDTYFYPNKNHGIYGGPTRLHLFNRMTKFLKQNLMNDYTQVHSTSNEKP